MFGNRKQFGYALIVFAALFLSNISISQAVLKDTDVDGVTDEAENTIYLTDPNNHDTDSDGYEDGYEIANATNPLDPNNSPLSIAQKIPTEEPEVPMAWYIARASGILAFILFSIVVINGLLMTTRLVFKLLPPALNYEMHTFLSYMGFIVTIGHVVALTFDSYFKLSVIEAIVPFMVVRKFLSPMGFDLQWTLGIGSLAFYSMITLIITSQMKGKLLKLKVWRIIHYASFPAYFLFLAHGIFSGSDTKTWWMIWMYGVSGTIVLSLVIIRIYISATKVAPAPIAAAPVQQAAASQPTPTPPPANPSA